MHIEKRHMTWRRVTLAFTMALALAMVLGPTALADIPVDETRSGVGTEVSATLHSEWPLEVGVYYIADYPGTADDLPNAASNGWGVYNTLRNYGWCNFSGNGCFLWSNANAWEEDFRRPDWGGTNDYWVDKVDLAFYEGHGNPSGFTFYTPSGYGTHDDSFLSYNDARLSWGDGDLEWMALLSCSVLADSHLGDWAWTLNGLHLLMGFKTTAYDVYGFGPTFANLVGQNWYLPAAWFRACDQKQPPGVVARVLAEESYMWYDRASYQYPDIWDNDYYWWTHTCGSELPRAVDVSQIGEMPVFETPPLSLDEQNQEWDTLTTAFGFEVGNTVMAADSPTRTVSADGRELEMDNDSGLFYYIDHTKLFTETQPALSGLTLLTAEQAQATADAFLTNNGLMPGDAQFYEVVEDTQTQATLPGRQAGLSLGAAEVVTTTADYQVIYSRVITYTPPGLNLSAPMEFSVVGPGAKLKVYVEPTASSLALQQTGTGDVSGAMGGWRRVQAEGGPTLKAMVPVLPYDKVEKLFEQLEPQVALANVPFQNPTNKEVLSYTLAYWEGPAGVGQGELIPAYALTAKYSGSVDVSPGVTETQVVTGVTYIPSNAEYIRPYAKIIANSAEGKVVVPGDKVVLTAADASLTLAQLGHDASLDFVLGSGDVVYEWYRGSVADGNSIGTGRTITYTVTLAGEDAVKGPVAQNIVLRVVDLAPRYEAESLDSLPIEIMPPLYLPAIVAP